MKNVLLGNEKDDVISYVSAIANMSGGSLVLGVVNMGDGIIVVEKSQIMGGHDNEMSIASEMKERINDIVAEIEKIKVEDEEDKNDIAEEIFLIKTELGKASPSKQIIKRSLRALKTIGSIVQEKLIEQGIDQLLKSLPL